MMKFIYEQAPYYYEHVGGQAYGIKTEIEMVEDASLTDLVEAMVKLAKIAGYGASKKGFLNAVEDVFGEEEE